MTLFGLLESECEERVIKNASTWITVAGGGVVPSMALQQQLCPNMCSGHGKCRAGICFCDKGNLLASFF